MNLTRYYSEQERIEKKSKLIRNPLGKNIGLKIGMIIPSLISTVIASILQRSEGDNLGGLSILILGLVLTLLMNTIVGISNGYKSHRMRLSNTRERFQIMTNHKTGYYKKFEEVPKRKYEYNIETVPVKIEDKIEDKPKENYSKIENRKCQKKYQNHQKKIMKLRTTRICSITRKTSKNRIWNFI